MKSSNGKLSLVYVLVVLLKYTDDEHSLTREEIRDKLKKLYGIDVDVNTVSRCINKFEDSDIEIIRPKGRDFGYRIVDRVFEPVELRMLSDAAQAAYFISEDKANELINKLSTLTSVYNADVLKRQVYPAGCSKTKNIEVFYGVDAVNNAINDDCCIRFQYTIWNSKKNMVLKKDGAYYNVSPFFLVWNRDRYYLIGWDNDCDKIKHFRVDKMLNVKIIDEKRRAKDILKEINPAEYVRRKFNMFSGEDRRVKFLCTEAFLNVALDCFGTDAYLYERDDKKYEITSLVTVSDQFFGWLAGESDGIEILEPLDVRQQYVHFLEKALIKYNNPAI